MSRPVGIGMQDFEKVITENNFYVDKTLFIKEWWENKNEVTLITRLRRFGKTLTLDMVEKFFSLKYADRGDLLFAGKFIFRKYFFVRKRDLNAIGRGFFQKSFCRYGRCRGNSGAA